MSNQKPVVPDDPHSGLPIVAELMNRLRLIWLLLKDERVPTMTKSVIPFSLMYLIWPVDIIADFIPVLGQLDDLGVLLLGMALFIKLSPHEVVQEYLHQLEYGDLGDEEAIDTTYQVLDEEDEG